MADYERWRSGWRVQHGDEVPTPPGCYRISKDDRWFYMQASIYVQLNDEEFAVFAEDFACRIPGLSGMKTLQEINAVVCGEA